MSIIQYVVYSVERHVYDLDVFEILDLVKVKIIEHGVTQSPSSGFATLDVELIEMGFIKEMKTRNIDIVDARRFRNYIILPTSDQYPFFLMLKLLVIDPYKIPSLLSYQMANYSNTNQTKGVQFPELIEFNLYDQIKVMVSSNEYLRCEKIMEWVEKNRNFIFQKEENALDNDPIVRDIKIDEKFAKKFIQEFRKYFDERDWNVIDELLVTDKFSRRICFRGQINQISELFKRLRYNSLIEVSSYDILANWITENFTVFIKEKETLIKIDSVKQVFSKSEKEPTRERRILTKLAEFRLENNRL